MSLLDIIYGLLVKRFNTQGSHPWIFMGSNPIQVTNKKITQVTLEFLYA